MSRHRELLMPGLWSDHDGLHFCIPELLKVFGWPDDATHCARVEQLIRDLVADHFPDAPITEVD